MRWNGFGAFLVWKITLMGTAKQVGSGSRDGRHRPCIVGPTFGHRCALPQEHPPVELHGIAMLQKGAPIAAVETLMMPAP
jgi:hypothetical protein